MKREALLRNVLFGMFFVLMLVSFIFDREILRFLGELFSWVFPSTVLQVMYYASHYGFFIIVVAISGYLLRDKKKVVSFLFGIASIYVVGAVLKLLVQRVRPLGSGLETFSFPSGHVAVYFFIFAFMAGHDRKYKLIFLMLAVLVSISRIYLGVHYLSDVSGGALLGVGMYLLFKRWIKV